MSTTLIRIPWGLLHAAIRVARARGDNKPVGLEVEVSTGCGVRELQVQSVGPIADGKVALPRNCVAMHLTSQPTLAACHELRRWLSGELLGVLFLSESEGDTPVVGRGFVRAGSGVDGITAMHVVGPGAAAVNLSGCACLR